MYIKMLILKNNKNSIGINNGLVPLIGWLGSIKNVGTNWGIPIPSKITHRMVFNKKELIKQHKCFW